MLSAGAALVLSLGATALSVLVGAGMAVAVLSVVGAGAAVVSALIPWSWFTVESVGLGVCPMVVSVGTVALVVSAV